MNSKDTSNNQTTPTQYTGINRILKSDALQVMLDRMHDGTFKDFFADWKWIFGFSKKYRGIIVFYTIIGILGSTLSLGSAYVSRILINIIVERQMDRIWLLVGVMVGSLLLSLILSSVNSRIFTRISIYVNNDIQAEIFDRIIDARWKEISEYPSGDLLNRFNNDVGTIAANAINWIPNLIVNIYMFIITFIVLFRMDIGMAAIAFISAPFLLGMSRMIMRKQKMYRKRVLELNSGMMSFEAETFFNFEMIKSFGIFGYYSKRLKEWQKKYKDYNLEYNMFSIKTNILLTLVGSLVGMTAFGYCLYRLWTGQIMFGDMTFFLQQRSELSGRFSSLVGTIPGMLNSAISAHRIRELTELPREKHDTESFEKMKNVAKDGLSLHLDGVSFGYQEDKEIYKDMDFSVEPGEIVALLASSGGGKTTLMRILLGLLEPDSGTVTLATKDGERVEVNADLRYFFSYVPQGNTILSGTIAENMRMVRSDVSDAEIIVALKTACAWDFVEKLPEGINGTLGERGRGISEGQAQRIAIARALLRDAPILLLDEATSALDADTEEQVLLNIIKEHPNKVILVSTHRPGVLKLCKRIYRILDGSMKELSAEEADELVKTQVARKCGKVVKDDSKVLERNSEALDENYDDLTEEDETLNRIDAREMDRMYLNHVLQESKRKAASEGSEDEDSEQYHGMGGGITNNSDLTGGTKQGGKGWWQI